MKFNDRFVYHIKDSFFTTLTEKGLNKSIMLNKENGAFRPTFYCMKDKNSSLLWMVPMSSKYEKYEYIYNKKIAKFGKCDTLSFGSYGGKKSVFLIQNMFPISPEYIDHLHTINGEAVPVHSVIAEDIRKKVNTVLNLTNNGYKVVFTDIIGIKNLMLNIAEQVIHEPKTFLPTSKEKSSILEQIINNQKTIKHNTIDSVKKSKSTDHEH